jgi:hypothetical protein
MAGQLEYSGTATSNTAINSIPIQGSSSVKYGNDAIQQLMADQANAITKVVDKTGTYTAVKADFNQMIRATGTLTLNLTAAATLTAGWCLWVKADGGAITIDPAGAELINGAATLVVADGSWALVIWSGSAFRAVVVAGTEEVRVALSQSSLTDTTPNKLMKVGAFGVGAQLVSTEPDMDNYTTPGAYVTPSTGLVNLPPGWPTTGRHIITMDGGVNYGSQVIVRTSDGKTARRGYVSLTFSAWVEDIQAYGGTMTGFLTLNADPTNALHAATKQYVDALPITKEYVSAEQAITSAGALVLAHGLGARPKLIVVELVCKTAEFGYSVNDVVNITGANGATTTTRAWGCAFTVSSTNVEARYSSNPKVFQVANATTGDLVELTNANWRMIVRAFA